MVAMKRNGPLLVFGAFFFCLIWTTSGLAHESAQGVFEKRGAKEHDGLSSDVGSDQFEARDAEIELVKSSPEASIVAHFHPALVHFPIAWVVLLFAVELIWVARKRELSPFGLLLLWLVVMSLVPAIISGWLRGNGYATDELADVYDHRNVNLCASGLLAVIVSIRTAWFFRARKYPNTSSVRVKDLVSKGWLAAYVAALGVAMLLMLYGAYLGGRLVHGANYV